MPGIACTWEKPPEMSEDILLPRPVTMRDIVKKV
jgi:hypothetical protein